MYCTSHVTDQIITQATKAAIESFVRTWNNEFGAEQGITINAVNPGPVKSVIRNFLQILFAYVFYFLLHSTEVWDTGKLNCQTLGLYF